MKILKTLAVFFVLLALTAGAVAEVEFAPFIEGELDLTMPAGVQCTILDICETEGVIEIEIDSEETDWSTVVTKADGWGEICFDLTWNYDDTEYVGTRGTQTVIELSNDDWSKDNLLNVENGYRDCYENFADYKPSSLGYGFVQGAIANYSITESTMIPREIAGTTCMYVMGFFYGSDNSIEVAKYATIKVTHTDKNARRVSLNLVPEERIVANTSTTQPTIEDGSILLELDNGHSVKTMDVMVKKPEGANSYVVSGLGDTKSGPATDYVVTLGGIAKEDFRDSHRLTFLWYKGAFDENMQVPTGDVLRAEAMSITVSVGDPVAWPNYIDDGTVTTADVDFIVSKDGGTNKASFIKVDYDQETGTAQVVPNGNLPNEDLTRYELLCSIKAPENAVSCITTGMSYQDLKGASMTASRYEQLNFRLLEQGKTHSPVVNRAYVCDPTALFSSAKYSADPGLLIYHDINSTNPDFGYVTMVDWYDEEDMFINRQWFVTQYQPMAKTMTVPIITEPISMTSPVLIAEVAVEDYELQVTSYPQTSESGTQIHYELKLVDTNGEPVDFSKLNNFGEIQLLIPYPAGASAKDFTFTVNHYDAAGDKVAQSVTTADTSLTPLDEGLLMTVTSLSPFVLSWETTDVDVSALPSTGDNSLPLTVLMGMLALAVTGAVMLRKKANA